MNQVTCVIDPSGAKTSYEYDKIGQLTAITDAKKKSMKLMYDGNGNVTSVQDEAGRTTAYAYDLADQLVKVTDGENIDTVYTYDNVGNLSSTTDGNGNTTAYTYDLLGRMTSSINPLSEVQEFAYDLEGRLKEEKQADGTKIQYDYNKLDQLLSVDYGEENKKENILYAYDKEGRRISMEDVTGSTSYEYDEAGRISLVKTSDGKEIKYSYDTFGNLSKLTYPDGKTVNYTYDELDRLTVLTDRNKKETNYTYDDKGNLVEIKRPNKTTTKLSYDVLNQVTKVENLNEEEELIFSYSYTYDNSGFITKEEEKQYKGKEKIEKKSRFAYDLRGQLTQVTEEKDGKETQIRYTYDKAGNRICIEKSEDTIKKQLIENQYNEANRLTVSNDSTTGETSYEYDKNGNMVKELATGEEIVTYQYDVENRLNSVKEQGTLLMAALYDGDGNRIFTVEKRTSNYEETIAGHQDLMQGEQSLQKPTQEDTYLGESTWNHITKTLKKTFIRQDILTKITVKNQISSQSEEKIQEKDQTVINDTENKSYTPTTEITEEKIFVDPTTHIFWYGFGQGILQGFTGAPQYLSAWFHDAWDYVTNQYYLVRHIKSIEYKTGEESTKGNEDDGRKAENGKKIIVSSNETSTSTIDPSITTESERKIKKEKQSENESALIPDEPLEALTGYEKVLYDTVLIPSGTTEIERDNYVMTSYVNDVNQEYTQVLMEYDVNDEVASVYDYGVQRNSYTNLRSGASQTQYYMYDGRGSVSSLTGIYGNPVVTYQYDAYGKAKVNGDTYNRYQYNGEAVDTNTGLQYLRARYYNSSMGGFITQDTYTGTLEDPLTQNLYTYTGNNPVNLVDPSGNGWISNTIKKVGGAIATGVKNVYNAAKETVKNIASGVKNLYNDAKNAVTKIYNTVTNKGSKSSGGSTYRTSGSTSSSSGNYSYTTTTTTTAFNSYLESQMEAPEPVDPVTASMQSRFGADAEVTKMTDSYVYVNGKLVTAMSDNEHKMCTTSKKIQTNGQKNNSKGWNTFFDKKTNQSGFFDWNNAINSLLNNVSKLSGDYNKSINTIQDSLEMLDLVPGADFADAINAVIYTARGDYKNAAIATAGVVPVIGDFATGGKIVSKGAKGGKVAKEVGKIVDKISDDAKGTKKGSKVADAAEWTNHEYKHFPQNNMSWKDIIKSTKNGPAKYSPGTDVEALERMVWEKGTSVTNGKTWKVMEFDDIVGATAGAETKYMRVEMSGGTIHGHPISKAEYKKLIK